MMPHETLDTLLLFFFGTVATVATFEFIRRRSPSRLVILLVAIACLCLTIVLGTKHHPGSNYLGYTSYVLRSANWHHVAAALGGFFAGSAWLSRSAFGGRTPGGPGSWRDSSVDVASQGLLCVSMVGILGSAFLFLKAPSSEWIEGGAWAGVEVPPGYTFDEVYSTRFNAVRIAAGAEGEVFVSLSRMDLMHEMAMVVRLSPDATGGGMKATEAVSGMFLHRPFGLAYRDGELYICRSGHYARAVKGRIIEEDTGVVTRLSDLDGDGYFEYLDDVITGLPGVRGNNAQHHCSDIVFDDQGRLFIANGIGGNREPGSHALEGAVLVAEPDFSSYRVFAGGFRNPWSLCLGPDGQLFGVDNDEDIANSGDEFNHLIDGEHYGHPYVVPAEEGRGEGFRDPLLLGDNFIGIAYSAANELPEADRGCFFAIDGKKTMIYRIRIVPKGATYEVTEFEPFASVPGATDLAITDDGTIYVTDFHQGRVGRIRYAADPKHRLPAQEVAR